MKTLILQLESFSDRKCHIHGCLCLLHDFHLQCLIKIMDNFMTLLNGYILKLWDGRTICILKKWTNSVYLCRDFCCLSLPCQKNCHIHEQQNLVGRDIYESTLSVCRKKYEIGQKHHHLSTEGKLVDFYCWGKRLYLEAMMNKPRAIAL